MDAIKGTLTRKLGPLPVWVWGALLVAAIAIFLVWRRSKSSGSAAPIQPAGPTQPAIDWTSVPADPVVAPLSGVGPSRDNAAPPSVAQSGPPAALPIGPTMTSLRPPLSRPINNGGGVTSNMTPSVQRRWRPI